MLFADRTQSPDKIDEVLMDIMNLTDNQKALTATDWDDFISEGGDAEEVTDPVALKEAQRSFSL